MTAADVLDLFGRSQRQSTWRFMLTDQNGESLGELPVNRDSPPTIAVDTARPAKRTLQRVAFPPGVIHDINVISERMRVDMVLGDESVWPQGTYLFTSVSHNAQGTPLLIAHDKHSAVVDLVDQTLIVDQLTDQSYTARPFTLITDVLAQVLGALPVTVNVASSGARIGPEAISWPPGTNRLRIVNELATMLGYHELYFDNAGVGQLNLMPDPLLTDATDVIDFSVTSRITRPSYTFSDDILDLPNRFVVIGSGATETPAVGIYTLPASAPHSIANRGFAVTHSEQQQGIETSEQARTAAVALSRRFRFAHETIDFTSPPDPRHDHYNTLSVENVRWLEVSWSMSLSEGNTMQHTARRTYEDEGM